MTNNSASFLGFERRLIIIQSLHAERTLTELIDLLGHLKSTVYRVANENAAAEGTPPGPSIARQKVSYRKKKTMRTSKLIPTAQKCVHKSSVSIRTLMTKFGVSERTMPQIVNESLRYTSPKLDRCSLKSI